MANWWDEAYSAIQNWSVDADQRSKTRQSDRDTFMLAMAEKGKNYELTSKMMRDSTDQEKELMQGSADLDRRNTLDTMAAEHNFQIAGLQESNRLGKDYMAAEGYQQRESLAEEGYQKRELQRVTNEGQRDVSSIQAAASNYGQDSETTRNRETNQSAERQRRIAGDEERRTIRTTGDENRRNVAFEREHAAGLSTRMSRR